MQSLILYLTIFFVTFFLSMIGSKYYKKRKIGKIFIAISFILLVLFFGFRYEVGTDYKIYLTIYNLISKTDWHHLGLIKWEFGTVLIFKLISILFSEPKVIFVILSILTLYPIYHLNRLYNYKYLPYSVLIFCFIFSPFSTNGMRQAIAMGFTALSTIYLIKRKPIPTIVYFLIAILFHKTAMILLPYLLLYLVFNKKNITRYMIILTSVISIAILFFGNKLMGLGLIEDYTGYLQRVDTANISFPMLILYIPTILITIFFHKKDLQEATFFRGFVVSGIILDIVGTSSQYLSRISLYFSFFQIIYIPYIIKNIKDPTNKLCVKIMYIAYLVIYFIYQFYILGKHEIFPYQSWLF